MDYNYEIVTTPKNIPAKIIINSSPNVVYQHWHKDLELIYSYDGSFTSCINGENCHTKNKDLILVNSGAIHSIDKYNAATNTTLTILISYSFLKFNCPDIESIEFNLNRNNKQGITRLKEIYEEIGNIYIHDMKIDNQSLLIVDDQEFTDKFHFLKVTSLLYEIFYILLSQFSIKKDQHLEIKSQKHLERVKIITEFIDNNYKDNITLDEIADTYDISKEYLATIFKKYMGITIGTYLKNLRLKSAYRDLLNTDYSINQLAFDNGFPNIKSFISSFKDQYGKTPYKYKKDLETRNEKNNNVS